MKSRAHILFLAAVLVSFLPAPRAAAALKSRTVDYVYGGKTFQGYLAWDDAVAGKRPGVLVVHEWWGLNDYARSRADQLAKAGYVAFAADMYGGGKIAAHPDEAGKMAGEVRANVQEWLGRAEAALQTLRAQPLVDPARLAAIGYCFGGATVLQLAYSGADLKAVASFHGSLFPPEQPEKIKAKIWIFHGGKDPFVKAETLQQVRAALEQGKVAARIIVYPDAVHGFTVPGSERHGLKGVAYDAEADRKSWAELLSMLEELFSRPSPRS